MIEGGSWMPRWKMAYIKKACRLRRKLTNKALAIRLGIPLTSVTYHSSIANKGSRKKHVDPS